MKEMITYHDNGNIHRKFHEDDNGNKYGSYQSWYINGQPLTKCNYNNGNRHGLYQSWYNNGQLWEKCHYSNGNRHGLFQKWYKNGQLTKEAIYINGVKTTLPIPTTREEKILFKIKHGISL